MCARARTSTDVGISRPVIGNDNYIYYNNTTTTSTPRTASPLVARHSRGTGGVVWKVDGEARCLPVHPSTGEYPWECLAPVTRRRQKKALQQERRFVYMLY